MIEHLWLCNKRVTEHWTEK